MKKILVWDLPIRIFHWLFAGLFVGSFAISHLVSKHNPLFGLHALFGILLVILVVYRVIWGIFGSEHAKLKHLFFSPAELIAYVKDEIFGPGKKYIGHNPGAAYFTLAILIIPIFSVLTGFNMVSSGTETLEEVHELLGNGAMVLVGLHVLGILTYTLKHKELISLSMIKGTKMGPESEGLKSSHPIAALVLVVLISAATFKVFSNFNFQTGEFYCTLTGQTYFLFDKEDGEGKENGQENHGRKNHEDKEDDDD
ncbi:MAG: hypothetical protein FMNOHCHN_03609 [Ignavibacteriaceae bacterium]|nr:hypothetical protein [Ignavibacteriaceae bacterium]GIL17937.1 MAG: hypothetical protein BroJett040_16880 [Oligoflexia bacterium]